MPVMRKRSTILHTLPYDPVKRIACFHLLNDFSGSPHVLSTVLDVLVQEGYDVRLNTSATTGFLSSKPVVTDTTVYRWHGRGWLQIFLFIITQCQLFFTGLFRYRKYDVFYINTLLPFGAAVAGRLTGKEVICHIHEKYVNPNLMQRLAYWTIKRSATQVIFVSRYLQQQYPDLLSPAKRSVVYNVLPLSFTRIADAYVLQPKADKGDNLPAILMVSSLKTYKGVDQFAALAARMPQYTFCLVVSASQQEAHQFHEQHNHPNLSVYSSQSNIHPFYQQADLVLNLSLPDCCVETFGMTLLEAMRYGLPVIVPPAGGPTELIEDGVNGYLANARDLDDVQQKITHLLENKDLYNRFSEASLRIAKKFDLSVMEKQIKDNLNEEN